jgi:hypothetical protein
MSNNRLIASITLSASMLWAGSALSEDVAVSNLSSLPTLSDNNLAKAKAYSNPLPPPRYVQCQGGDGFQHLGRFGAGRRARFSAGRKLCTIGKGVR